MENQPDLNNLLHDTWQTLSRGAADTRHGFHWPVLGTAGPHGVEMRKVVLRQVDRTSGTLRCYSDKRTGKVAQIKVENHTTWLFYDARHKVQLRVKGRSVIHHQNDVAREVWDSIPPENRRDYTGPFAPGTPLDKFDPNLAAPFRQDEATRENTAFGYQNFCVVETAIEELEYLALHREGHIRCLFTCSPGKRNWQGTFLAP